MPRLSGSFGRIDATDHVIDALSNGFMLFNIIGV
jgi:hypothetical protein